jgi:PilZ domain
VKRQQVRRRRHQSAWITLENGTANCKCQVEDVSRTGAKITVDTAVEIGTLFDIAFVPRAAGRRREVVWRPPACGFGVRVHRAHWNKQRSRQALAMKEAAN